MQLRRHTKLFAALLFVSLFVFAGVTPARDHGSSQLRLRANGFEIDVFTYRPDCEAPSILFVFHGLKRKAKGVREKATTIADGACLMVFAPLFDKARFPNWRYHRAGVVRDNRVQPPSHHTAPIVRELLEHARRLVGNAGASVYFFGHSAGGQFLSRLTAYTPVPGVARIVVANPSVHVVPSVSETAPYGFGGFTSGEAAQTRIKDYLAAPITIYLGAEDTRSKYLVNNAAAKRQGKHRLQRGRNVFRMARELAVRRGWPFAWQLVEVPDVGHSSRRMLGAPALYRALGLPVVATGASSGLLLYEPAA